LVEHGDGDTVREWLCIEHELIIVIVGVGVIDRTIIDVVGLLVVDRARPLGESEDGDRDVVGVIYSVVDGVDKWILIEDGSAARVAE
jgi:hypothetical protein